MLSPSNQISPSVPYWMQCGTSTLLVITAYSLFVNEAEKLILTHSLLRKLLHFFDTTKVPQLPGKMWALSQLINNREIIHRIQGSRASFETIFTNCSISFE